MKRLLSFILLIFAFSMVGWAEKSPVDKWGQLQVRGTQLCDEQGNAVTLRGVSIGWHNLWPRFYNKQIVKTLHRDWHATVIRAAMGVKLDDNYLENPEFAKKCIETVVKAAIREGVYVIVDWHAHDMYTKEAVDFFDYMSKKYGDEPAVIYEIYNEPVNDTWPQLKEYASAVIKAIRRNDPDNIILVGCPHWDQDINLVAESPLKGFSNIMYTVHYYAGTHKDYLRNLTEQAIEQGVPVFLSESGAMEASGDGPIDYESQQKWVDMLEKHHVSWIGWSVSDKNETCSMLLPRASSTGPWADDVIKPYGKLVKKILQKNVQQ